MSYLLDAVNDFFGTRLAAGDLTGAYAGVRPLIASGDPKKSVDISRRAELFETSSGLVTITGGKLTTWRRMAKQAVDRVAEREGREAPCRTHEIPLGAPLDPRSWRRRPGVEADSREHLARRYGHAAQEVVRARGGRSRAGPPPEPCAARHRGRGRPGRGQRAGDFAVRRAAAAHPPRPAGRPRAVRRGRGGAATRRGGHGGRARLGPGADAARSSSPGARTPAPRASCPTRPAPRRWRRHEAAAAKPRVELAEPLLMGVVNATPDSFSDQPGPKRPSDVIRRGAAARGGRRRDGRRRRGVGPHRHRCGVGGRGDRPRGAV